jgi:3-oxoadipate enol-lactonase
MHRMVHGSRHGAGSRRRGCRRRRREPAGLPWAGAVSRTRYARSGELRIAYELRGTMRRWRPWLVLIQGMGFGRSGWEPVLGKLRRHFRLVLVDNRGSGLSGHPAGLFAVADMAGDVLAVLDAAGIGRAHVLGASLGGMVAQELAVTSPERVDGLVLACTAPGWPFSYPMPRASVRLIAATAGLPAGTARPRLIEHALSARTVRRHPELVDRLIELQSGRPADIGAVRAQAAAGALYRGCLRQARIHARTLVLHGGADTVVDPRNGQLLAARIPAARLVTFPELGHLLFWEDPDGFADAVTSFLLDAQARRQHRNVPPALPGRALHRGWRAARQLGRVRHPGSRIRQPDHVPLQRLRQRRPG